MNSAELAEAAHHPKFIALMDGVMRDAKHDKDLAEGIRWIVNKAIENGLTFHEQAYLVLQRHQSEKRARDWLAARA